MSSKNEVEKIKHQLETTGDVREFLARVALAVIRDEVKVPNAAVAVKACEQINVSLYSEIKRAALQIEAGKTSPVLGKLKIADGNE
jgi:folylpolyglutamate synthase/dihydropteroate synthase